jgi:hypothetical protein
VTKGILTFLGLELPEGRKVRAFHQRQSDELNHVWIERYRAG